MVKAAFLPVLPTTLPLPLLLPLPRPPGTNVGSLDESLSLPDELEVMGGSTSGPWDFSIPVTVEELSGVESMISLLLGALKFSVCPGCISESTSTSVSVIMSLCVRPSKVSSSVVEPIDVSTPAVTVVSMMLLLSSDAERAQTMSVSL